MLRSFFCNNVIEIFLATHSPRDPVGRCCVFVCQPVDVAGHPRVGRLPLRHPHHGRRNRHRLLQEKTKGII